jgi:DNA processing protein
MPGDRPYWVALNHVRGVGAARVRRLKESFATLHDAWHAPRHELLAAGLDERSTESLCEERQRLDPEALLAEIEARGIEVLTWEEGAYPRRLAELPVGPPVLYVRGALSTQDEWAIAIVGTRRPTAYGREAAVHFASTLAGAGLTIVSGLARGIDAEAHRAALEAGGRSIAVMGCGVDTIYPAEHARLAQQIMECGALVSDYAPGTPPDAANFPPRNRIIAGLSLATIVVEAGEQSGALLTAGYAADQGRDVFAVPGSVFSPASRGTNRLIQDGAQPAIEPNDILSALDLVRVAEHRQARMLLPDSPTEARLLEILGRDPLHMDAIRLRAELPIEEVSSALAMMELKGLVRHVGGMQYVIRF